MKNSPTYKKEQQFAWLVAGLLFCFCAYRYLKVGHLQTYWLVVVSVLLTLSLARPAVFTYPRMLWEKLGYYLALVNTTVLLTLIYFLILVPLALLFRLTNRDLLGIRFRKNKTSYWQTRDYPTVSLKNQF